MGDKTERHIFTNTVKLFGFTYASSEHYLNIKPYQNLTKTLIVVKQKRPA